MRRLTTLALSLAFLTAACSGDAGVDPAATASAVVMANVEEAMGAREAVDPGEIVVPEGCHVEIVTDEYGFEVEVVICDDQPTTTTSSIPATDPSAWLESPDARQVANTLYDLLILQEGCAGTETIARLEELAEAAPEIIGTPLAAAADDLYRMAAACNVDVDEWQQALNDALDELDPLVAILRGAPNA